MKRTASFLLLFLLLFTQLGTVIWFSAKPLIHYISSRRQADMLLFQEEKLFETKISALDLLALSTNQDEIKLNGKFYEINTKKVFGDSVSLLLQPDEWETSMLQKYDKISEWFARSHPLESQKDAELWKLVLQIYTADHSGSLSPLPAETGSLFTYYVSGKLPPRYMSAPFLPPRFC